MLKSSHHQKSLFCLFFSDTPPTEIYTLSLHDALPILGRPQRVVLDDPFQPVKALHHAQGCNDLAGRLPQVAGIDRKSTRLNSSHMSISYAVFCLKKKNRSRR